MRQFACAALVLLAALGMNASAATAAPTYGGIVVDAKTGKVLYSENADSLRYPASLTKMMTLYLTFEALESGRISLNSKVPISAHAASEPPSKLGVGAGRSVTVEQAILSLVTRSANDVATALGEFLGGSEARFAQMMTSKARSLGMTKTTYRNANGLPNTAQMTTARDQARLGIALRQHFPQYYGYFSTRSFKFGNQVIGNHNRLLGAVRGVDGIKTGYTRAAGFNLVTSAQADGRSIVGVVMGAPSGGNRNARMTKLVQAYLPKASRGGSGDLIAKMNTSVAPAIASAAEEAPEVALSAPNLPSSGPLPETRYDIAPVAYAAPANDNAAAAAIDSARITASRPLAAEIPVPQPAPAYMPDRQAEAATVSAPAKEVASASADIDETTTASTQPTSGWVVQIGTSPDRQQAMGLLRQAQDKGGKVLRSATPFTVAYNAGSAKVYRARFGGFDDQKTAVNACKALKKKGIGCWASAQ
ncbi:D-alanyl-D-alanine carboxypeptidase [Ciceribacter naphthalenivorans]|uniref:Penicillin-binding protein n=3 Tax=Alphaproteobacteria TaxID=28211 RepID=A0A512HHN2_9HYPH|nr:penicillin-binding protein [Ciceribacter naphthalenivorans]GLR22898.1 penicillin-binding protein [Ciceribacter naphthalenivorans]GLT05754.1 penicillin-binding protein [Sphingomonas psychrolutea]